MRVRPTYTWRVDIADVLHIEARWSDDARNFGLEARVGPQDDPVVAVEDLVKSIEHTQELATCR